MHRNSGRSDLEGILEEFVARYCGHGVIDFLAMLGEQPERAEGPDGEEILLCLTVTDLSGDFDPAERAVELDFEVTAPGAGHGLLRRRRHAARSFTLRDDERLSDLL